MTEKQLPPGITPPQQTRSQDTMTRILDAAQQLLETKNFDAIAITEIVEKAGCSVGAFYGRFKDKDALLHALDERYFNTFYRQAEELLRSNTPAPSLQALVENIFAFMVEFHTNQRGLIRTLILRARASDDPQFRQREDQIRNLIPGLVQLIQRSSGQLSHPDPQNAILFGFYQAIYSIQDMLLWPHITPHMPYKEPEEFVHQLTRAYLAYLGAPFQEE